MALMNEIVVCSQVFQVKLRTCTCHDVDIGDAHSIKQHAHIVNPHQAGCFKERGTVYATEWYCKAQPKPVEFSMCVNTKAGDRYKF